MSPYIQLIRDAYFHIFGHRYYAVVLLNRFGPYNPCLSSYIFTNRTDLELYLATLHTNKTFTLCRVVTFRSRDEYPSHHVNPKFL